MGYNIVIRSPNWVGDCVMALPAIRALKDNFPAADIYLVVKQNLAGIYENIAEIKEIIPIPAAAGFKSILKASGALKKYRFQWGILFTNSFSSALLFKLAGIGKLTGYVKDWRGFLLDKKIAFPRDNDNRHHIDFYLDLVGVFLEEQTGREIRQRYSHEVVIGPGERERVSVLLSAAGIDLSRPLLGISPCAAYGSGKEWLPERYGELIERLAQENPGCEILLFGSAQEQEKISRLAAIAAFGDSDRKPHNLAGQLSLREVIIAISLCGLFVGSDSGLMHIASSLNLPLVALFGPTRPGNSAPLNENARIIHYPVECAPCTYRECPRDHRCMKAIRTDEVYETLVSLLSRAALPPF